LNKEFIVVALNILIFHSVNTAKNIIANPFILISHVINYVSDSAQLPSTK